MSETMIDFGSHEDYKPTAIAVNFDNIPAQLRGIPHWVLWRYEERSGKWTKPPHQPNGSYAKTTDPTTWNMFEVVKKAYEKGGFAGVGFVLTDELDIVGIDLDHCIDVDENVSPMAWFIAEMVNSYTEISPSGEGLRIFAFGDIPEDGRDDKKKGMEIYKSGRYLTITGCRYNDLPISENKDGIQTVYDYIVDSDTPTEEEEEKESNETAQDDLIGRFNALLANDQTFKEKFETPANVGDRSEHEFYLCCYILEKGFNSAETRAIMDTSPQTKWRGRGDRYKSSTIKKAFQKVRSDKRAEQQKNIIIKYDDVIYEDDKGNEKFSPTMAAKAVIKTFDVIAATGLNGKSFYWVYDKQKGIYDLGDDRICQALNSAAGDKFTITARNETLTKITYLTGTKIEEFDKDPYLLCVKNGVIDLGTGEFGSHDPKHKMTIQINTEYRKGATCPKIDKFLHEISEYPEDVDTVYDIIAAMCIRVPFDAIITLIGAGSNGKGVLSKLIHALLGDQNITRVPLGRLDKPFAAIEIHKKLVIINSETEGTAKTFNIMKAIATGEPMDGEIKFGPYVHFTPYCKILQETNNPQVINDHSYGKGRRAINLNYRKRFTDKPNLVIGEKLRNPHLLEEITTDEELAGLLNVIISRAPRLIKERLIKRLKSADEMSKEYDKQSHSVSSFVEDRVEITNSREDFVSSQDVIRAYNKYCTEINTSPSSDRALSNYLIKECKAERAQRGPERTRGYIYVKLYK